MMNAWGRAAAALIVVLAAGGCSAKTGSAAAAGGACAAADPARAVIALSIKSAKGTHDFCVETAKTEEQQRNGLMYRTDLKPDGGMLFWPYPPEGGTKEASFWMKNTPTPLDIVFIRADGTIARIAENTVPFSEEPVSSGEQVGAVLELVGGRTAALGIAEGDTVNWTGRS